MIIMPLLVFIFFKVSIFKSLIEIVCEGNIKLSRLKIVPLRNKAKKNRFVEDWGLLLQSLSLPNLSQVRPKERLTKNWQPWCSTLQESVIDMNLGHERIFCQKYLLPMSHYITHFPVQILNSLFLSFLCLSQMSYHSGLLQPLS